MQAHSRVRVSGRPDAMVCPAQDTRAGEWARTGSTDFFY